MVKSKEKALFGFLVLLLASALYYQFREAYFGDKDWLLVAARRILEGVPVFEINPPLILWIYSIPAWLSMKAPLLRDYQYLALFGFMVAALSIYASHTIVEKHPVFQGDDRKIYLFTVVLALILVLTHPCYFADRDHLGLMLTLPYILRFMPSVSAAILPFPLRVLCGFMAAIGFCIKPQFAAVFFVLQIMHILRERKWNCLRCIENRIIYAVAALYVASIFYVVPEYIHTILPMALVTYGAIAGVNNGTHFAVVAALVFGVTFADFRWRQNSPYRKDILYFIDVALSLLLYAVLNHGWGYSWNPLISFLYILTLWVLFENQYLRNIFGIRATVINLSVSAFLILSVGLSELSNCQFHVSCERVEKAVSEIKELNKGELPRTFGTITITAALPLVLERHAGMQWSTRFNHLWMLPEFFAHDGEFSKRHHWIIENVARALAEDLDKQKPDIVFVSNTDEFYTVHRYVDLAGFLAAVPEFRKAGRNYLPIGKIDDLYDTRNTLHTGYYVFRRKH